MWLSGGLEDGSFVIHVQFSDAGTATSTTGSGVVYSAQMSPTPFLVSHPHTEVETSFATPARSVRFADVPHGKLTPLDGVMIGGAVLCPIAWGLLRSRYHDVATRRFSSPP